MAEFIEKTDTLNEGREKINAAIQDAEDAKTTAGQAVNTSNQAKQIAQAAENKADNVQEQFNQVVIEGDSSVEAAQARVDADNNVYATLKERLDTKETQFTTQLEQTNIKLKNLYVDVTEAPFNAKGDGSDETVIIQQALDYVTENNLNLLIPTGKTFNIRGLLVENKDNFGIICEGVLRRADNAESVLLDIINCSNFYIPKINFDGNVFNNTADGTELLFEHYHELAIRDCVDFDIGIINDTNPCGDTVYLNGAYNCTIKRISTVNDIDCGRNTLSIIRGENIIVDDVYSINHGIDRMPGGVDIEPNKTTDVVKNVIIHNVYVETIAQTGLQVTTRGVGENIEVNGTIIKKGNNTDYKYNTVIQGVNGFRGRLVNKQITENNELLSDGLLIANASDVDVRINLENSLRGVSIYNVKNLYLTGTIRKTDVAAINFITGSESENIFIDVDMEEVSRSETTNGAVRVFGNAIVKKATFKGDYSRTGGYIYGACFRIDGELIDCVAEGVDMSGWNPEYKVYGVNASQLMTVNCKNFNYASEPPMQDHYKKGVIVWNTEPSAGAPLGWVCTASGRGNLEPFGIIGQ